MRPKTIILTGGAVVALGLGWAVFRPELLFVDQTVNEAAPLAIAAGNAGAMPLLVGQFRGVAHETKGTATVLQSSTGGRVLRLTGFETSNGPDVRVLLVTAADAADNDAVKNGSPVELGLLKGNVGDQNYDVPADLDLAKYRSVVIWCNRFGVNFGTAPLMGDAMQASAPMNEPMPFGAGSATTLAAGMFHAAAHETKGTATLYQLPGAGGKRLLRLTGFETSNGPDVRVLLAAVPDATDNDTVKGASPVELGKLKGNVGDQNYDVPAHIDLSKYRSVVIWCNRFSVNFGTAPLQAP